MRLLVIAAWLATPVLVADASPSALPSDALAGAGIIVAGSSAAVDAKPIASSDGIAPKQNAIPVHTASLQLGWQLGSDDGHAFSSLRIDAGYHLGRTPLWVHAGFALGAPIAFSLGGDLGDKHYVSGSLREIAGGIEARKCPNVIVCAVAGVDVGYETVTYDDTNSTTPSQSIHVQRQSAIVIPRLQLDVGSDHVRFRPTVELPIGASLSATHFTVAIAVQI